MAASKTIRKTTRKKILKDKNLSAILEIWEKIEPCCEAIYITGSRVDPIIKSPHDYDYVIYVKSACRHLVWGKLESLGLTRSHKVSFKEATNLDLSLLKSPPYDRITWFSYLDVLSYKVVGSDVCPKTDVINTYRNKFIECLREKAEELETDIILNKKRWYHILRGIYILQNNSYDVTDEQKKEINILHDLSDGWENIRNKTIKLLKTIK